MKIGLIHALETQNGREIRSGTPLALSKYTDSTEMKMAFQQIIVMDSGPSRRGFTMTHLLGTVALVSLIAVVQLTTRKPSKPESSGSESRAAVSPAGFLQQPRPISALLNQTASFESAPLDEIESWDSIPAPHFQIQTRTPKFSNTPSPGEFEYLDSDQWDQEGQSVMARQH